MLYVKRAAPKVRIRRSEQGISGIRRVGLSCLFPLAGPILQASPGVYRTPLVSKLAWRPEGLSPGLTAKVRLAVVGGQNPASIGTPRQIGHLGCDGAGVRYGRPAVAERVLIDYGATPQPRDATQALKKTRNAQCGICHGAGAVASLDFENLVCAPPDRPTNLQFLRHSCLSEKRFRPFARFDKPLLWT